MYSIDGRKSRTAQLGESRTALHARRWLRHGEPRSAFHAEGLTTSRGQAFPYSHDNYPLDEETASNRTRKIHGLHKNLPLDPAL
jgi:hypothetical protein